jgi:hypothetical protein
VRVYAAEKLIELHIWSNISLPNPTVIYWGFYQGILRTTKEAPSVQIPDCRLISAAWAAGSPGLICNCVVGRRRSKREEQKVKLQRPYKSVFLLGRHVQNAKRIL